MVSDGLPEASVKNSFISKCKIPSLDYVVFIRGSGPHAIDYGYTEDKPPKEVIVSRKCAEAVLRGAHVSMQCSTLTGTCYHSCVIFYQSIFCLYLLNLFLHIMKNMTYKK